MSDQQVDLSTIEDALPIWMQRNQRPPWIKSGLWKLMPADDRESMIAEFRQELEAWLKKRPARMTWPAEALSESIEVFFVGIKDEGRVAEHTVLSPDYGRGVAGAWQEFSADNANAAQYLNLFKLIGRGFPPAHFNLCGELTVNAILGLNLGEGLKVFRDTPSGADVLADRFQGTLGPQLGRFIRAATGNGFTAEFRRAASSSRPEPVFDPAGMQEFLNKGGLLVTLVNIEGFRNQGRLKPVHDSRKKIAHWIAVTDVIERPRGEPVIRTYNPFHNEEELYNWPWFKDSWLETEGNFSRYGVVAAERV